MKTKKIIYVHPCDCCLQQYEEECDCCTLGTNTKLVPYVHIDTVRHLLRVSERDNAEVERIIYSLLNENSTTNPS